MEERYLYKIVDNASGTTYETNNLKEYEETIEELKDCLTETEYVGNMMIREEPKYIMTTYIDYEDEQEYRLTYFDKQKD